MPVYLPVLYQNEWPAVNSFLTKCHKEILSAFLHQQTYINLLLSLLDASLMQNVEAYSKYFELAIPETIRYTRFIPTNLSDTAFILRNLSVYSDPNQYRICLR